MTWTWLVQMAIIIHFLKCLEVGHLEITLRQDEKQNVVDSELIPVTKVTTQQTQVCSLFELFPLHVLIQLNHSHMVSNNNC